MKDTQNGITGRWSGLNPGARMAAIAIAAITLAAIIWTIFMLTRQEYRTLFSQLSDPDAASIVAELKRQKIPYRFAEGGSSISVPAEQVHDIRLNLMSSNVLLSGGVGFEIFDNQSLGTTEQAQRISYQRALQGELARTIAALDHVKLARVHLVLPESSLFKRDQQEATAAVTLTLTPGATLDRAQIIGVQRLVAASVSGLEPARVVITDQRGVTLSFAEPQSPTAAGVESRLDVQRQVEAHLSQKIARMLDGSVGPGQAIVSVDVALRFDAIKTTTQNLLPLSGGSGPQSTAVLRRRQVTSGERSDGLSGNDTEPTQLGRQSGSTTEIEYEYGRRVEEVIAAPGAIRRVTVGVIVPPDVDPAQQERIRDLVRVAAGIDDSRGDVVSVQPLGQPVLPAHSQEDAHAEVLSGATAAAETHVSSGFMDRLKEVPATVSLGILLLIVTLLVLLARPWRARPLSVRQREQLLEEIRRTLGEELRASQGKARQ